MKKNIAVIFGGTNTEHEVSIVSARSVIENLDPEKYNVFPLYITKQNQWVQLTLEDIKKLKDKFDSYTSPTEISSKIDVFFPVMHGPYGEDGTIQGLLEMLHKPYVGCGVLSSAMCMDKVVQKQLCLQQGLPVIPFVWADQYAWSHHKEATLKHIQNKLKFPLFVKPANQGSSVGVTMVHREGELSNAINQAFEYDSKIIIEQGVEKPIEAEVGVLGNHEPKASVVGEIKPSNEFYDYDAKYIDGKSVAIIPTHLPEHVCANIQQIALKAFKVMNCSGIARIDFLVNSKTLDIYLNELNTLPGFTAISMYPKLWQATKVNYSDLLDQLITLAIERHDENSKRQLTYTPTIPWHQS